jgi:hypothetical protein
MLRDVGLVVFIVGLIVLGSGICLALFNRFLKVCEFMLVDIATLLGSVHTDRRKEHQMLLNTLAQVAGSDPQLLTTPAYLNGIPEDPRFPYLQRIRSAKHCTISWALGLFAFSSPILTIGLALLFAY